MNYKKLHIHHVEWSTVELVAFFICPFSLDEPEVSSTALVILTVLKEAPLLTDGFLQQGQVYSFHTGHHSGPQHHTISLCRKHRVQYGHCICLTGGKGYSYS